MIAILDDTAMTNMYRLHFEAMIVIDQETNTQLLTYSIIPNKFQIHLLIILKISWKLEEKIVVDRFQAQIDAIQEIFSGSYIVFCLVHIRRDLLSYFWPNDEIITSFEHAIVSSSTSLEFLII